MPPISTFFQQFAIGATAAFLGVSTNPSARRQDSISLQHVLIQYQVFTRQVANMLSLAKQAISPYGWTAVVEELERNIGQECGSDSNGVAHHRLLATALRTEFGFEVEECAASPGTAEFIAVMITVLSDASPYCAAGAAYALEYTAVPELIIVRHLIRHLAGDKPLTVDTNAFFDRHLDVWEPSHEQELRLAVAPWLSTTGDRESFSSGFGIVMAAMDKWWLELASEAASW